MSLSTWKLKVNATRHNKSDQGHLINTCRNNAANIYLALTTVNVCI